MKQKLADFYETGCVPMFCFSPLVFGDSRFYTQGNGACDVIFTVHSSTELRHCGYKLSNVFRSYLRPLY